MNPAPAHLIPLAFALFFWQACAQQATNSPTWPNRFMGREVTVTESELDADGLFAKGLSVCLEAPPGRECYTAPKEFGAVASAGVIQIDINTPALFVAAEAGPGAGTSRSTHFALLRPGTPPYLDNVLDVTLTNQSRETFWSDPTVSNALIFLTADFAWGDKEARYDSHRYIVSAYLWKRGHLYFLEDRYMTVKKYGEDADILASERQEILARLRQVTAETKERP